MDYPTDFTPVTLTQADVDEFKAIVRKETGVEMENQETWNRVIELTNLY